MYQLIYQSVKRPGVSREDLRLIAKQSMESNRANDLTGVLVVEGDMILQVLEGEEQKVRDTYHRISQDRRHGGCSILLARQARERLFSNWIMGFYVVEEEEEEGFRLTLNALRAHQGQLLRASRQKMAKAS